MNGTNACQPAILETSTVNRSTPMDFGNGFVKFVKCKYFVFSWIIFNSEVSIWILELKAASLILVRDWLIVLPHEFWFGFETIKTQMPALKQIEIYYYFGLYWIW